VREKGRRGERERKYTDSKRMKEFERKQIVRVARK
jgi:hypothetical protein